MSIESISYYFSVGLPLHRWRCQKYANGWIQLPMCKRKKKKKEKVIWDSRLPQSIIIIVHIKISSSYTGKAFCFTGFFNDSYSWLVKPLICHRLLKDLWEETLKTLCFLYIEGIFHKIQMAENKVSWNFNKLSIERILISLLKRKSGPGLQLEIQEEKKSCCI